MANKETEVSSLGTAWDKITTIIIGVVLSITAWTFHQIQEQHDHIIDLNAKMALLVDHEHKVIPSPINEIEREKLRRDLEGQIHDLMVMHITTRHTHP